MCTANRLWTAASWINSAVDVNRNVKCIKYCRHTVKDKTNSLYHRPKRSSNKIGISQMKFEFGKKTNLTSLQLTAIIVPQPFAVSMLLRQLCLITTMAISVLCGACGRSRSRRVCVWNVGEFASPDLHAVDSPHPAFYTCPHYHHHWCILNAGCSYPFCPDRSSRFQALRWSCTWPVGPSSIHQVWLKEIWDRTSEDCQKLSHWKLLLLPLLMSSKFRSSEVLANANV